jgi:hypothetical protein
VWQLNLQRKHNYKSVKPIGHITFGDYESSIHVRIYNFGVGPMIIKKALFKRYGLKYNNVIQMLPDNLPYSDFVERIEGRTVIPGGVLTLIEIKNQMTEEEKKRIRTELGDIIGEITYTDIYEKQTFKTEREFNWFKRSLK